MKRILYILFTALVLPLIGRAQNPLIHDQFTADPTARVFNGKVYVFPSHDIRPPEGEGRLDWFNMADYHVFSSENLVNWEDHGVIVSQEKVEWVNSDSYSMWAPDCVEKDGKYYFYFPSRPKDTTSIKGFTIGVAIADKPEGPYEAQKEPIPGVRGIDPNVFIDNDGKAYLYWSAQKFYVAELKDNMTELATEPMEIPNLPTEGLKEGPFVFERNGLYYMTYPHVANKTERLEYATGPSPTGPFKVQGVIMDEHPSGVWTNHHSIIEFKDQWYLFYHNADYSPDFDKLRSIRADSLFFQEDGLIKKVEPTLRGVGIVDASEKIQVDRCSGKSEEVSISFNNPDEPFEGWHIELKSKGDWVKFDKVYFSEGMKKMEVRVAPESEGKLEIRTGSRNGPVLSEIDITGNSDWEIYEADLQNYNSREHNLYLTLQEGNAKVDWIRLSR